MTELTTFMKVLISYITTWCPTRTHESQSIQEIKHYNRKVQGSAIEYVTNTLNFMNGEQYSDEK